MLTTACFIMLSFAFHMDGFQYFLLQRIIFLGGMRCDNIIISKATFVSKKTQNKIYEKLLYIGKKIGNKN